MKSESTAQIHARAAVSDMRLGIFSAGDATASDTEAAESLPQFWPMRRFLDRPDWSPEMGTSAREAVTHSLDTAAALFEAGHWRHGMQLQHHAVAAARLALSKTDWRIFANEVCLHHPVCDFVHQDPFTRRSFQKPRGYAGDAVLIDYMYGIPHPEHEIRAATALGRWICNYSSNTMAPRAVRRRMTLAAELIDRVCSERQDARILSIASGHGRELQISHAVRSDLATLVVAFDQDETSLSELAATAPSRNVRTIHGSIARLIAGRHDFSEFDLVYALGLFDYLETRAASRLAEVMFGMLRRGGSMLIGNFLPDIYDAGYMESFMGWDLKLRTRSEIIGLLDKVDSSAVTIQYFEESERNIGFALARKV